MFRTGGSTSSAPTAAQIASAGASIKLAQWGVPVGIAPTGTMGNNGAVTLGTALNRTYSNGIWLFYPAGAVAAGVPASATYLWTVMSSSTVGTVYNSTFDGSTVPAAGSTATPFATTGPGAFTGDTTIRTAATITIPANTLGASGAISGDWLVDNNTAAGTKLSSLFYSGTGGTDHGFIALSTVAGASLRTVIRNNGTGAQEGTTNGNMSNGTGTSSGIRTGTADTTASTTLVVRMTNATATNWQTIEGASFFYTQ